jgi:hypothetical protein
LLLHDYLKARAEAKGAPLDFDLEENYWASEDRLEARLLDDPFHSVFGVSVEVKRKWTYLKDVCEPSAGFLRRWLKAYQGRS